MRLAEADRKAPGYRASGVDGVLVLFAGEATGYQW